MRPGKSPSSKRLTPKKRLQNSPVLQPLLLLYPIIFASCVIYARKRKGFRACGRDQRAFRSPFGNLRSRSLWESLQVEQRKDSPSPCRYEKARFLPPPLPPHRSQGPPPLPEPHAAFRESARGAFLRKAASRHGAGSSPAASKADLFLHLAQRLIGAIGGLLRVGIDQIL